MPGRQGTGRQGLHTEDNGGGTEFQGETAGTGTLTGVRGGNREGVTGGALPNPARRDERGVGAGGKQGSQGRQSQDLQDGYSRKNRTDELPSQRV